MNQDEQRRASGETPANEEARDAHDDLDQPIEVEIDVEDPRLRVPAFSRMRVNWNSDDFMVVMQARRSLDTVMSQRFPDAYMLLAEIQDLVRIPLLDDGGTPREEDGTPLWERDQYGMIVEDFSRMTRSQIQDFIGRITTRLVAWEQISQDIWMEAMMAKGQFEERFARTYEDAPRRGSRNPTVDDCKAHANAEAADERYFAIYATTLSRRAESLVKSMDRLVMRLHNILVS